MNRAERIKAILTRELAPHHLEIIDDSHKHAGHAGARPEGETHYSLIIGSAAFTGKTKVQAHQMVYTHLKPELDSGLHALAIRVV
jgi:BolA protein